MLNLYSFYWDCGRMGEVTGLFIAEPKDVAGVIGKEVYFGEILGKHSEVYGIVNQQDIELVSDDQEKVQWLLDLLGTNVSGWNPLHYPA